MTDKLQHIVSARNHAFELMLEAQALMDAARTEGEKRTADGLYYAAWGAYTLLVEAEKNEKRKERGK